MRPPEKSPPASQAESRSKLILSTGETGEFAAEKLGFGSNPRVVRAAPNNLSSNRRESGTRENLRNVGDTGEAADARCCQQNMRLELG